MQRQTAWIGGENTAMTSSVDTYYARLADYLSRMEDGETFSIRDKVCEENREQFMACFNLFFFVTQTGPYWWEWDDERDVLVKHAHGWYKKMRRKGEI